MKKLSLLFIFGIFTLSSVVKANIPDYIITRDDVKFYSKVTAGEDSRLIGMTESGGDQYDMNEVVSYRKEGRVYEKMPVILNDQETGNHAFMELIAYKNGLKLYRHNITDVGNDHRGEEYLVFRDGGYVVRFNEKNSKTLNKYFFSSSRDFIGGK
jgi:hypothetical protein